MVVVRASGYLFDHQILYGNWEATATQLQNWLENLNIGGVILLGGSAGELSLRTEQLQSWAKTPLFIAADIEEGVGQRFAGATHFPPPMALGAIAKRAQRANANHSQAKALDYAYQMGAITAREALAIGINWVLAPVVDVNNNPENPVINVRAFADDPHQVADLTRAFIEGAKSYPVLTTAKHFPGHGDTATDSHLHLPVIAHPVERLESVELLSFQSAIAAGVDAVMSAHLLVSAWDDRPATLSYAILTGQLRQRLGFTGLIVTDALIMGGVANYAPPEEISLMAVEAGADVLLMPSNPETAIEAVYQAVQSGRINVDRIHSSLERIWRAKQKLSFCPPDLSQLAKSDARTTVTAILEDSMEISGKQPLSLDNREPRRNLIVVDDLLNCEFLDRHSPAVLIPKQLGYEVQIVDQNNLTAALDDSRPTLLQVFVRGNPFRGTAGLTANTIDFYRQLLPSDLVSGVIIYGSPYVLQWFRALLTPDLPLVFSYGQIKEAQTLACESLFGLSKSSDNQERAFL
jgi:beta-glucosidase